MSGGMPDMSTGTLALIDKLVSPFLLGGSKGVLDVIEVVVVLVLVVVWLAVVGWTYADARRRISDRMLIVCATAAALLPFVGSVVYMLLRPPEQLDDARERELGIGAAEARLEAFVDRLCPHCDYGVEEDFLCCPSCAVKLKRPCLTCGRPLDLSWTVCPFCDA